MRTLEHKDYAELLLENIKLRQVLVKYANHNNWCRSYISNNEPGESYDWFQLDGHGWKIAEEVLNDNQNSSSD